MKRILFPFGTPESLQRIGIALLEKENGHSDTPLENK